MLVGRFRASWGCGALEPSMVGDEPLHCAFDAPEHAEQTLDMAIFWRCEFYKLI
jgi:hypothetical protein